MKPATKRRLKWLGLTLLGLVCSVLALVAYVLSWPDFGGTMAGKTLERARKSLQWNGEHFQNDPIQPAFDLMTNLKEMAGDQVRQPPAPFPLQRPKLEKQPAPGLRAYWFGHATVLVEIDGFRVMSDPMLTDHAFPVHLVAPERFNPPPLRVEELPRIDAVVVSHDHFDHLDMATIQALAERGSHFYVGLGVGAHLRTWKVPEQRIHEMDWWESERVGGLRIHCTPARHYSGRTGINKSTLWASWVIEGSKHRVFHSGDSGYGPHFKAIGKRRGPIDLSLIKIGDYGNDRAWEDIHMIPENSIRAHLDLGAKTLLPIHWGTFELSYHAWNEPIERATKAAERHHVDMVTPFLGQVFSFGEPFQSQRWWAKLGASGPS